MHCAGRDGNELTPPPAAPEGELEDLLEDALGLLDGLDPVEIVEAGPDEDASDPPTNPTRANLMFVGTIRAESGSAKGRYRRLIEPQTEVAPPRRPSVAAVADQEPSDAYATRAFERTTVQPFSDITADDADVEESVGGDEEDAETPRIPRRHQAPGGALSGP